MYACMHVHSFEEVRFSIFTKLEYFTFQLFGDVFLRFNSARNQLIRMISEGLCHTEDWRNGAENSALYHRNILHFKIFQNT